MAKKRRTTRPSGGLRRLHAVPSSGDSPGTQLARLRGAFTAWLRSQPLPVGMDPAEFVGTAADLVDLAATRAGLVALHSWTPEHVARLAVEVADPGELSPLPVLLIFLRETGRWSGTAAEYDVVFTAAESAASALPAVLADLAAVAVDPAAERTALVALPMVRLLDAALRYLGPGRRATSSGGLGRAELPGLAEALGIDLGGTTPRSLWDVPELATVWSAVVDAELVDLNTTRARVSAVGSIWLGGDEGSALIARPLIQAQLVEMLSVPAAAPWAPSPVDALLPALIAAVLGRPLPAADLLGSGDDSMASLNGDISATMAVPLDQLDSDGVQARIAGLVSLSARAQLQHLAAVGLLTLGTTIDVPAGLRRVVADAVADVLRAEQGADAGSADPDPALADQAWLLRIELDGANPAIWREVLVDPNTPLPQLHWLIQSLFGWGDAHLHEFSVARPGGHSIRYAPPAPDAGFAPFGEPARDEGAVRLAQVLTSRRPGALRYRYDFGDDWDHSITLRDVRPADGPLPRCTGGSGAGLAEDSGGVWGWADRLVAVGDPGHPDHDDVREWLGLADGEVVDPRAFDLDATDARLAAFRR